MTEQTEHTTVQPGAVPARIELEDVIEAVTRGVARALAAQDDVSGYAASRPAGPTGSPGPGAPAFLGPPIIIGLIYTPPGPVPGPFDKFGAILNERQ